MEEKRKYNPNSVDFDVYNTDFGTLINMIKSNEIMLDYEPEKPNQWSIERKSRFIESAILGVPMQNYFFLKCYDKLKVIDGYQQLYTIKEFLDPIRSFQLKGLKFLTTFNNMTVNEIAPYIVHKISCLKITYNVLRGSLSPVEEYEVIKMVLNDSERYRKQEFRNQYYQGQAISHLKDIAKGYLYFLEPDSNYELANQIVAIALFDKCTDFEMAMSLEVINYNFSQLAKQQIFEGLEFAKKIFGQVFCNTNKNDIKQKKKISLFLELWKSVSKAHKGKENVEFFKERLQNRLYDFNIYEHQENQLINKFKEFLKQITEENDNKYKVK